MDPGEAWAFSVQSSAVTCSRTRCQSDLNTCLSVLRIVEQLNALISECRSDLFKLAQRYCLSFTARKAADQALADFRFFGQIHLENSCERPTSPQMRSLDEIVVSVPVPPNSWPVLDGFVEEFYSFLLVEAFQLCGLRSQRSFVFPCFHAEDEIAVHVCTASNACLP